MADITLEIPVIDASKAHSHAECVRVAEAFSEVGCLAFRGLGSKDEITPRLTAMLVDYFRQPDDVKARDIRAKLSYQVGLTPAYTEFAVPRPEKIAQLLPEHYPTPFEGADPKERFFTRVGPPPTTKLFPQLAAKPVVPAGFPDWTGLINQWGDQAIDAMMTLAEMAAEGFGLERNAFSSLLAGGQHLFAPTGSDLSKHGAPGTVLAAFHDDLNFMSIHGKSNFPGLRVWKRDGTPVWVRVPDGCLLAQAGQQFEHLTGGKVLAGLHEVVSTEAMHAAEAWKTAIAFGVTPWRVSTTLFGHVMPDHVLKPLLRQIDARAQNDYPPIYAGDQVMRELALIGLASGATKH
jgi:isopenicillin N synthase-like dioxygenase